MKTKSDVTCVPIDVLFLPGMMGNVIARFAVSTSTLADEIKILEDAADNLMCTRIERPMKLLLKIDRMKGVGFSGKESQVPISEEMLKEINEIAEITRKTRIPEIKKI